MRGNSKTAFFGSRKLLVWLLSCEASSQAPHTANEKQRDFWERPQRQISAAHAGGSPPSVGEIRGLRSPWRASQPASSTQSRVLPGCSDNLGHDPPSSLRRRTSNGASSGRLVPLKLRHRSLAKPYYKCGTFCDKSCSPRRGSSCLAGAG